MMPDESSPEILSRHVFVYGTLRRTGDNDITRLQPPPRFVGRACVAGVLYHLGAYPGIVLASPESSGRRGSSDGDRDDKVRSEVLGEPQKAVHGEVYAISPALESILDEIEGLGIHPTDEYIKRHIAVMVQGQALQCLVYEINPKYVTTARAIVHGDWLRVTCSD